MRALTRITVAALAALLCARAAVAQVGDAWVEVAPEGEGFVARMPVQPSTQSERVEAGELKVEGRRYAAAGDDGAAYVVWVLDDPNNTGERLSAADSAVNYVNVRFRGKSLYLDQIAELALELLGKPEFKRLKDEKVRYITYGREFELDGRPAREYFVKLKKARGPIYLCADGPRIYVVAAFGTEQQSAQLKQFVESFRLEVTTPEVIAPSTGTGTGVGTGGGFGGGPGHVPPVDYTRPFFQRNVTRTARITSKPEPGFTEGARKFNVTGVVRIRAILDRTGEVTNVSVVTGLPHGLTSKAVAAAKKVKFVPAQKDGHIVSQYILFEYNFNIY